MQPLRANRLGLAAVLVATLVLGTLIVVHQAARLQATPPGVSLDSSGLHLPGAQASTATQTPTFKEPVATPLTDTSSTAEAPASLANVTAVTAAPATPAALARTSAPARPDLSGTWRGEYVDASGKQLLRVVSLSISRVRADGGIEGTLQYRAASGDGECKLHPRHSTYSVAERRLQLSPERCSPHYPKELGVPLDFNGVNPLASTLKDGRIEAPTGEVIRVKLRRVSGL